MFGFGLVAIWLTVSLSVTALIMVLMGHGNQIGASAYEIGRNRKKQVLSPEHKRPSVQYKLRSKNADELREYLLYLPNDVLYGYWIFMVSWTLICFITDTFTPYADIVDRLRVWLLALFALATISSIVTCTNFFFRHFIKALSSTYHTE